MSFLTQSSWPTLDNEIALQAQGYRFVAGLDEAGRGAWAGPVVAAAVILPPARLDLTALLSGVNDSKKLTPGQRAVCFDVIQQTAVAIAVGLAPAEMVDERNVVGATRYAMEQALARLNPAPDYLLIDHLKLPSISLPQTAFAKADSISLTVAAASIIAKVTRDRLMLEYSATYPGYAFERHKGYGTEVHRAALAQLGPCALHRLSYSPVQMWHVLLDRAT